MMLYMKDVIEFAMKAHQGQMYGNFPYIKHLSDVYMVLVEFGVHDQSILAGGWLHDVLEDTEYHYSEIKQNFGLEIAEIVFAITDELGRNRKERKEKTWPKLKENEKAFIVKQADMLANVRQGMWEGNDILNMYKKEFPKFKQHFKPLGRANLWTALEAVL